MYEIAKFIVYKFTVHCIVYNKLLLTSLQVYYLQQIVATYKFTGLLFTANCCYLQVTDQTVSYYTFALLLSQSESYYTFLHCLHVQEKHVATLLFIALL